MTTAWKQTESSGGREKMKMKDKVQRKALK